MAIIVIPRSQVTEYRHRYEVQEQARDGGWNVMLATDTFDVAQSYAEHRSKERNVRIIDNRS